MLRSEQMLFQRNNPNLESYWHRTFGPTIGAIALFLLEVIQIIVISAAIIIPIRYFLVQPFYVKGASMEPEFYDHEYLIIDEIGYRLHEPERGEIIVFRYPRDPSQYFIKRVIGLPGETIEVIDGRVMLYNDTYPNGLALDEPYLDSEYTSGNKRIVLGQNEYFVLGDNRGSSLDSRSFGVVPRDLIVGKVWLRGLPINKVTVFSAPDYNL